MSKKTLLAAAGLASIFGVDAMASTTTLSGTAGAFTSTATADTYGFGSTFVKMANLMSDNGLGKIIGTAAGVTGAVLLYNAKFGAGIIAIAVGAIAAFLPQAVDAFYGATI